MKSKSLIEVDTIVDSRRLVAADTSRTTADIIAQASSTLVAQGANRNTVLALLKTG